MAESSASESSSNSGSDFSDFEASIEDENNERGLEPVGERAKKQRIKSP